MQQRAAADSARLVCTRLVLRLVKTAPPGLESEVKARGIDPLCCCVVIRAWHGRAHFKRTVAAGGLRPPASHTSLAAPSCRCAAYPTRAESMESHSPHDDAIHSAIATLVPNAPWHSCQL